MRLVFFRHGDPDYVNNTLTETGIIEAQSLGRHIDYWKVDEYIQSPYGRAQHTADYALGYERAFGEPTKNDLPVYEWLKEFDCSVDINVHPEFFEAFPDSKLEDGTFRKHMCWDMVPAYLNKNPELFDNKEWRNSDIAHKSNIVEEYDRVCAEFDKLLAQNGYVRDGMEYRVEAETTKTIGLFCHFGITCVLLSHMMNVSPYSLWHGACMAPTSVTEVISEERQQGHALFRAWKIGDVSHLIQDGIEPAFAARFCEVYSDMSKRH